MGIIHSTGQNSDFKKHYGSKTREQKRVRNKSKSITVQRFGNKKRVRNKSKSILIQ
jgi:hypothetical protein